MKDDKLFLEFRIRKLKRKQLNLKRMDLCPKNEEKNTKIWEEIDKLQTKLDNYEKEN